MKTKTADERKSDERRERWDPRQRFRPYLVRIGKRGKPEGGQEWVAGAGCPTPGGIVTMLITLYLDGEFGHHANRVGVLDTAGWQRGNPGTWVINPHDD